MSKVFVCNKLSFQIQNLHRKEFCPWNLATVTISHGGNFDSVSACAPAQIHRHRWLGNELGYNLTMVISTVVGIGRYPSYQPIQSWSHLVHDKKSQTSEDDLAMWSSWCKRWWFGSRTSGYPPNYALQAGPPDVTSWSINQLSIFISAKAGCYRISNQRLWRQLEALQSHRPTQVKEADQGEDQAGTIASELHFLG